MDNVIITGGSRGIGAAIAARLAGAGYKPIVIARTRGDLNETAPIAFVPYDLSDADGIPKLVRDIRKDHGAIYGLINNAGSGAGGLLANMRNADIEALIRLNTLSPLLLTKYVARGMMAEGRGRIINMSSIIASTGYVALSAYAATKSALIGFTRSLARELGPLGVTVNAIAPGFIETELTSGLEAADRARIAARSALRRLADPEDVAAMVEFLLSEGAKNVTGAVMTVDAGATA